MNNTRHSITVRFDQVPDLSRRVTLVERLQRIYGVTSAIFDSRDKQNLTVQFRQGGLSPITLLDYLKLQGLSATATSVNFEELAPSHSQHQRRN
ncbi:MAG TPA: hypothetical protein PKH39_09360 [Woeseiaceae bacterium]|nr:hypothetical protein [Woeseiaceae bacterium]